jgi:hypothetical protein
MCSERHSVPILLEEKVVGIQGSSLAVVRQSERKKRQSFVNGYHFVTKILVKTAFCNFIVVRSYAHFSKNTSMRQIRERKNLQKIRENCDL